MDLQRKNEKLDLSKNHIIGLYSIFDMHISLAVYSKGCQEV